MLVELLEDTVILGNEDLQVLRRTRLGLGSALRHRTGAELLIELLTRIRR